MSLACSKFGMAAPAWIMAAKLIPKWLLECCDNPQLSVRHHAQIAERGKATPAMVVAEHDLYGTLSERYRDVLKLGHAHVGTQRDRRMTGNLSHAFDSIGGVFEIFDVGFSQVLGDPD